MKVATPRRRGAEKSETRAQLIRSAIDILRDEGAGAVTARRLAEQIGLQRHIVHYYFGTIDEVFVAIMREEGARSEETLKEATKTGDAFTLLWENGLQSGGIILELTRLALRHPAIAKEYKIYTERYRQTMAGILEIYAKSHGITLSISATAAALMLQSIACTIAVEGDMGMAMAHDEAKQVVLDWLKNLPLAKGVETI
ncbi:MAG: hypothetical protein RLZZ136_1052 [Pseudomonadota bacterium]|jgi:AcrR family transcriptional regulator